ncbi:MAG: hypothetical protein ACYC6L_16550 [Anaerolineae bacterium]
MRGFYGQVRAMRRLEFFLAQRSWERRGEGLLRLGLGDAPAVPSLPLSRSFRAPEHRALPFSREPRVLV